MGPHHGIRGTAWTGRVTSPWEPDSVKPGGLIKITIKKNKIGVDQYKKTLEPTKSKNTTQHWRTPIQKTLEKTKWINTADQYLRDRKKLVGELQNKNIWGKGLTANDHRPSMDYSPWTTWLFILIDWLNLYNLMYFYK